LKTKELLTHLSKIENGLNRFSFDELSTEEATKLKKDFVSFRNNLEQKVFGEPNDSTSTVLNSTKSDETVVKTKIEHTLIANVSHEIRTPLNGIVGFIDLLKETELTDKQKELVNALDTSSTGLMNIINELLEFSKLSAKKEQFESVSFNLRNLLGELSFLCDTLILDKNINFSLTVAENIPEYIIGDPSKLSQVLLNLLGNAIKFVEKGEIKLNVSLKSTNEHSVTLGFKISDTGIGIAGDQLENIFNSYQQASSNTRLKYGGTGLGLSIVKEIIDQLNGEITVSSILGVGTVFELEIPYVKSLGKDKRKRNDEAMVLTNQAHKPLADLNVLVFEDNELNQKLITNRLNNWGCNTIVTDNGYYGLKLMNEHKIDVVLMDIRMPGMTGFEITKQIRNHSNSAIKDVQIIALSADFSTSDKEQFKVLGINDFILKPFKPNDLFQKIIASKENTELQKSFENTQTTTKSDNELEELNFDSVLKDCMGQVDLLFELGQLFTENVNEFILNTEKHILNNEYQKMLFALHKVKNSLLMFKLKPLLEIIEQMRQVCETDKDNKQLNFLYKQFVNKYKDLAPKIEAELLRINNKE